MNEVSRIRAGRWYWRTEFGSGFETSEAKANLAAEQSVFYGGVEAAEANKLAPAKPMPSSTRAAIAEIFKRKEK